MLTFADVFGGADAPATPDGPGRLGGTGEITSAIFIGPDIEKGTCGYDPATHHGPATGVQGGAGAKPPVVPVDVTGVLWDTGTDAASGVEPLYIFPLMNRPWKVDLGR